MKQMALQLTAIVFSMVILTPVSGADQNHDELTQEVLTVINHKRESRGLQPLVPDKKLGQFAQAWAEQMAQKDQLVHRPSQDLLRMIEDNDMNGITENIAVNIGRDWTADKLVELWMKSQGHRHNLLREDSRLCGLGFARAGAKYYAVFNGARHDAPTKGN